MCWGSEWCTGESTEVRTGSITVISEAVGSSLMRFCVLMVTAEGQCYAALQQVVPQQPVDPLLLYLPPHKAGHWKAICESETPLCSMPCHCLLAWPLCRCQEEGCSLSQCIICWMCTNNASHVSSFQNLSWSLHICFQRMGACHTANRHSPHLGATAPPAPPPPRVQRDPERLTVHDSHISGPQLSMLNSWEPMDKDSTQESYVSD